MRGTRRLMCRALLCAATPALLPGRGLSQPPPLSRDMAPLAFLLGGWTGEGGQAEANAAAGRFSFEPAVGGAAILRRDHTELRDGQGRNVASMDQIMLISENGAIGADYFDGVHHIHYGQAQVEAGRSVVFLAQDSPAQPAFRLTYRLADAGLVSVRFEMRPPGQDAYRVMAEGLGRRRPGP